MELTDSRMYEINGLKMLSIKCRSTTDIAAWAEVMQLPEGFRIGGQHYFIDSGGTGHTAYFTKSSGLVTVNPGIAVNRTFTIAYLAG